MKKNINVTRKNKISLSDLGTLKFTGSEDHHISLLEASSMTKAYREMYPGQTKGHFFGKQAIIDILNQSSCVGIRIYYANDPLTGEKHLVIVGAESNMNDICDGLLAERSRPCPTYCGKPNKLNAS